MSIFLGRSSLLFLLLLLFLGVSSVSAQQEALFPLDPQHCTWINVPGSQYHVNHQLYALDLNCADGNDFGAGVYAILPGTVHSVGSTPTCGNYIDIFHEQYNLIAHHCHLNDVMIAKGATVSPGTLLGHVGTTGNVPSHLHFALIRSNSDGSWPAGGNYTSANSFNTSSLPAFVSVGSVPGNYQNARVGFVTSEPGTVPTIGNLKLEVKWPALPFLGQSLNDIVEPQIGDNGEELGQPIYLNNIINFVFRLSLSLAGVLAFISVVYAGFAYIISGANPNERQKALGRIRAVALGTLILIVSVALLNALNPRLTQLQIAADPQKQGVNLVAPTAPTGSGGQLFEDTQNHDYAPIPYTNREGTESAYALIVDQAEKAREECEKSSGGTRSGRGRSSDCSLVYENTLISLLKQQVGAGRTAYILEDDGEAPPGSCAAICMYAANDNKNCRVQTSDKGGAAALWEKIQGSGWSPNSKGLYPDIGIDDDWLRGEENISSRSCIAQYVASATDAPGNYGWDACYCNTP